MLKTIALPQISLQKAINEFSNSVIYKIHSISCISSKPTDVNKPVTLTMYLNLNYLQMQYRPMAIEI